MAGLLSAFMAGAANFGAKQIERSLIEDAQTERDARLAEIAREGQREGARLATEREVASEGRAEGRRKELGEAVTKARTGQVDDLSGSVRDKTPREAIEAERDIYAGRGLVNERLQTEQLIQRDEEGRDRKLERADTRADRQSDNERADLQLAESVRHNKAREALEAATAGRLAKGAELDNAIKQISLENVKAVQAMQKEFPSATPERKKAITESIQIITGKDNDNYLPVLVDPMDPTKGHRIFDKKRGEWVEPKTGGGAAGAPTAGAVVGGFKFKGGNPNDRSNWEPADPVLGGEGGFKPSRSKTDITKPTASAPTTYRDPMSGERITAAQWRKKYGENPREEG